MKIPKYLYKKMIKCNKLCEEQRKIKLEIDEYFEKLGVLESDEYYKLSEEEREKYKEKFYCSYSDRPFCIDGDDYVEAFVYGTNDEEDVKHFIENIK